jgi:hypothetical protein
LDQPLSTATLIVLLTPLILVQLGLQVLAAIDLGRRKRVRGGNKWLWAIAILLGIVGTLVYFLAGRLEDDSVSQR